MAQSRATTPARGATPARGMASALGAHANREGSEARREGTPGRATNHQNMTLEKPHHLSIAPSSPTKPKPKVKSPKKAARKSKPAAGATRSSKRTIKAPERFIPGPTVVEPKTTRNTVTTKKTSGARHPAKNPTAKKIGAGVKRMIQKTAQETTQKPMSAELARYYAGTKPKFTKGRHMYIPDVHLPFYIPDLPHDYRCACQGVWDSSDYEPAKDWRAPYELKAVRSRSVGFAQGPSSTRIEGDVLSRPEVAVTNACGGGIVGNSDSRAIASTSDARSAFGLKQSANDRGSTCGTPFIPERMKKDDGARKAAAKKPPPKKAGLKKALTKKAGVRKAPAEKAPAKKAALKKTTSLPYPK